MPGAAGSCRQLPQISGNLPLISGNLPERCLPPAGLAFALVKTAGFLIDGDARKVRPSKALFFRLPHWCFRCV